MQSINNNFFVFKHQNLQHHFELLRREPKAIFGSVISTEKEEEFFNYLSGNMYFSAPVLSQVPRT